MMVPVTPTPDVEEQGTPTVEEMAARIAALEAAVTELQQAVFRAPLPLED